MASREAEVQFIGIDGRWSLEDLYVFPRTYEQVYFAIQAIDSVDKSESDERIVSAFSAYACLFLAVITRSAQKYRAVDQEIKKKSICLL